VALVRGVGAAVLLAAAALGLAACGGDDEPAATEWADGFCSAVVTWRADLGEISGSIGDAQLDLDALEEAARDARAATDELVDELRALGAPETEDGAQAEAVLDELGAEIRRQVDTAREAVEDVDGATGVLRAISAVSGAFAAAGEAVEATVEDLRGLDPGGELRQAFEDAEACDELTAGR
jgi:hypothetical protein